MKRRIVLIIIDAIILILCVVLFFLLLKLGNPEKSLIDGVLIGLLLKSNISEIMELINK
jgi:hypothetical protein